MFIEKQNLVAINDIVTIKLMSGEELIGRLVDQNQDTVTLAKPVTVNLQPVSQNQMGLSLMPVLGSVEPDVTLQIVRSAMSIRPVKTGKALTGTYIEVTSGIITPNGGAGAGLVI